METTRRSYSHRYQSAGIPPSPRRPRSETPGTKSPSSKIHPSPTNRRSVSTTRSRTSPNQEYYLSPAVIPQKKVDDGNTSSRKFWQSNDKKKVRPSPPVTPSAWALSPGRSSPVTPKSSGGRVTGVLKYLRQRIVVGPTLEEVRYKEFRMRYNRLLQWRFVNARAEASTAAANVRAEVLVFNVWVRILLAKNSVMKQRIEMQTLKNEIRTYMVIDSQYSLLKEWKRIEGKNFEAVGRVARKLSATSVRVPLLDGAKGNLQRIYDALSIASMVLADIEANIMRFFSQVENTCYMLTELTVIGKQQKEHFEELDKTITMIHSFKAVEKSLAVQVLELLQESRRIEKL